MRGAHTQRGCPVPDCDGEMRPDLASSDPYRVALVGEALGADEAEEGAPFRGKAGFRLSRLIEWAGLRRSSFDVWNVVWCRPPDNRLEGTEYEQAAIDFWRPVWSPLLERVRVVVPMGNVPMAAFLGHKGILKSRGYIYPGTGYHIIPTVHPSFIQRGQSRWSAPFIHDLQHAVQLAHDGLTPTVTRYSLDPNPLVAYQWAQEYRRRLGEGEPLRLAYDIETPGKGEDEEEADSEDSSYYIYRVGFAYEPHAALSVPFTAPYFAAIRLLLGSEGEKVVWNGAFDNPRLARAGMEIRGLIHDGMVAWHILHSDLPKGLGFVSTFTCPTQPAWKHLSTKSPAFYNATDADVELRAFLKIEADLHANGLWEVYQKDVLDLEPILVHMHQVGMPIDPAVRLDRAVKLQEKIDSVMREMEDLVPLSARRIEHVYANEPKDKSGLQARPGSRLVKRCSLCGAERPRKDHFKRFVKKLNPCSEGQVVGRVEPCQEWFRLAEFTPSRDQLIRYQVALGRPIPMKFDKKDRKKKPTMDERAIKDLTSRFPDDKLYPLVLKYREYDKIAGTYIGRPSE